VRPLRYLVEVGPLPKATLFLKMDLAGAFSLGLLNVVFVACLIFPAA
jgi:hypothetical protein